MGDPKRGKPKDRKNEETSPDRVRPGLPSITAPSFDERLTRPAPDVSVTAPAAEPGDEERTKTAAHLDPSAYAATGDKDPDELASEFQPDSGKQLDAGGRLIAPGAGANRSGAATLPHGSPAAPLAPLAPEDLPATEVAVPAMARTPRKPPALTPAPPPPAAAAPEPLAPPAQKVSGQRREPGRWVLKPQEPLASEARPGEDPGAFDDPTVRRKPSAASRRRRRVLIAAGVVALLALGGAAGARLGWLEQVQALVGSAARSPPPPPPPSQPPALRLKVTSRPSNAAVRINGVLVGATPLDRESPFAPEAELEVEVVLKGHRTWTKRFRAGESVSAHAVLKPGK